ncbi:MAG: ribose-5-phosphate isomerase RpiA [Gammaproteobacteria bacterium]
MNQADDKKKRAALAALEHLEDGMNVGVGTGSTVNHFIDALPSVRNKIQTVVASSVETQKRLEDNGFQVSDLADVGTTDIYIDGADEANKYFYLIKGGGGALTREKILVAASRKFVCIIDDSKMVGALGNFPLPIEVIPMARSYVARQMIAARGQPIFREGFITDNGNEILDVHNLNITNPPETESRFNQIAGVVTVGIFANKPADVLLIAGNQGVQTITR